MKVSLILVLLIFPCSLCAQESPAANREGGMVSGEALWRQALGGVIAGLPSVQAQSVVAVLDSGVIKAYSSSGKPLWTFSARGRISPFVSRSREGTCYISRTNGVLIAVNRAGRELWRRNPGGQLSAPAAMGWDGRLFVPTGKKISCYTASGTLLWSQVFEERISLGPRLDQNGGIMFALENGETLRISPFGAAARWKLATVPRALLSITTETGVSGIMVVHQDGALELLDTALPGAEALKLPKLPAPTLAAVSNADRAAITLNNGRVVLVSAAGKTIWTADSHIRVQGGGAASAADTEMIFDEWGIYTLSASGATGFSGEGRRLWFTTLRNASGIPAFGEDGVLYSSGLDWILYAWKLEDRSPNPSPFWPEPEGRYGTGVPIPQSQRNLLPIFDESEMKRQLDTIAWGIQAGRVGEHEPEWVSLLMELAAGEYQPFGAGRSLLRAQPVQRAQALRLLSIIGSAETIPWLVSLFKRETEQAVKAAAAEAIGGIGLDPGGAALQAFLDMVTHSDPGRDEQTLAAVSAATGALCRFSGPLLSETGAKVLALLCGTTQPQSIRRLARRELETLRM